MVNTTKTNVGRGIIYSVGTKSDFWTRLLDKKKDCEAVCIGGCGPSRGSRENTPQRTPTGPKEFNMVPPSILILLSALSAFRPSLTESIESGGIVQDLPNELKAKQLLIQSQEIQDLANQLAMDYLNDGDIVHLSNLAKRVPDTIDKKDSISSMHRVFAREGIPPNLMKLSYGKRSDGSPFYENDVNDLSKRAYSKFMFGKRRDLETQHSTDKRANYSPLMFGKRGDFTFDKRDPEIAKKAYSRFFFGKRAIPGKYSKFMFGKREGDDLEMAADDFRMDEN